MVLLGETDTSLRVQPQSTQAEQRCLPSCIVLTWLSQHPSRNHLGGRAGSIPLPNKLCARSLLAPPGKHISHHHGRTKTSTQPHTSGLFPSPATDSTEPEELAVLQLLARATTRLQPAQAVLTDEDGKVIVPGWFN